MRCQSAIKLATAGESMDSPLALCGNGAVQNGESEFGQCFHKGVTH